MAALESKLAGRPTIADETSPLDDLLRRGASGMAPPPGQVLLGYLRVLPTAEQPGMAEVADLGCMTLSHSLIELSVEHLDRQVALSVLGAGRALVLGLVWTGAAKPKSLLESQRGPGPLSITVDGHREVIEAADELELRCGEAAIVLTADGRIQLRGTYITSHASATQRIVGGSVHVN